MAFLVTIIVLDQEEPVAIRSTGHCIFRAEAQNAANSFHNTSAGAYATYIDRHSGIA